MGPNSSILLIILSIGLLIIALILLIRVIIKEFEEKSNDLFVFIIVSAIPIIFLIPIILGLIQDS